MQAVTLLPIAIPLCLLLRAEDPVYDRNPTAWVMYFGDHPVGDGKWGVHLEAQWRRDNGFNNWQQSFYRPAVNYDLKPWLQLSGGYAYAKTYPYGDFPVRQAFDEHRLHQQATLKHQAGRVKFAHRLRHEQRWIDVQQDVAEGPLPHQHWRLQQRFRWQARADIPITKRYYVGLYNEAMVHVPPNRAPKLLDQNRAYAAFGIQAAKSLKVEIGYLNQYLIQRNGRVHEVNHSFQLAFFSNANLTSLFRFR